MTLIDADQLRAIDADDVLARKPFPFLHAEKLVTDDAYRELRDTLPPKEMFSPVFGRRRPGGQKPHDKYVLQYKRDREYPEPWMKLIDELKHGPYQDFIARLLGHDKFLLHFHWFYTPTGCSVSPHCDASWKYASHIFYLNTEDDWDASWGGDTLILDDSGRMRSRTAPNFDDFDDEISSPSLGNRSLIFLRGDHSWHGVRELKAPEGKFRKVFIVEVRQNGPIMKLRTAMGI